MRKIGYVGGILVALLAVVAIIFFGRQHQAATLRSQADEHAALVAKQKQQPTSKTTAAKPAPKAKSKAEAKPFKYVALGDSLAAGSHTTEENQAYQYVIARYLKNDLGYKASLDGYWEDGATIPSVVTPNYDSIVAMKPDLITIELGTNEQDDTNPNYARSATFKDNLAALVDQLQTDLPDAKLILLTTWKTETSTAYDKAIQAVGTQADVPVVDISSVWENAENISQPGDASWTGEGDGYHPNDAGNKAIAKLVEKQIDKLVE